LFVCFLGNALEIASSPLIKLILKSITLGTLTLTARVDRVSNQGTEKKRHNDDCRECKDDQGVVKFGLGCSWLAETG